MALGLRIAQLRKERDWTQQELAEKLGIAQQMLAHYEVGRTRMPASLLPLLASLFAVPVDILVGTYKQARNAGIAELPKNKQRFVVEMLETVLAQAGALIL